VTESSRAEREQAKEQRVSVGRFGMERDHLELPVQEETAAEAQHKSASQSEPSVPASSAENGIPADPRPTEPMMSDAPPQGERVGQPNAPLRETTDERREESPVQDNAPPDMQEQQRPQDNELPDTKEQQPPQDVVLPDTQGQQPPQDIDQPNEREDMRLQDDAPPENGGEAREQPQRSDEPQEQRPQDRELPDAPERQEDHTDATDPNWQDNGYAHNQHEEGGKSERRDTNEQKGL